MDYDFILGAENYVYIKEMLWNSELGRHAKGREITEFLNNGFSIDHLEEFSEGGVRRIHPDNLQGQDYHEVWINGSPENKRSYYPFGRFHMMIGSYKLLGKVKPIEDLIKENKKFIYLIDNSLFERYKDIKIPQHVIDQCHLGNAVIVIHSANEPYSFDPPMFLNHIISVGRKFKLNRDIFKILTGDLKPKNDEELNFEFIPYNYFWDYPWFINLNGELTKKRANDHKVEIELNLHRLLNVNKNIQFDRVGLCYQRRAHTHRRLVMYEFYNDKEMYENIYLSFWNESRTQYQSYEPFGYTTEETTKINEFFKTFTEDLSIDSCTLSQNQASNIEMGMHKKTFISLVSETRYFGSLFFSEKTYKPMYCLQPFILINANGSLKHLKEIGFKTFDKWWDESYDTARTFKEKLEKIKQITKDLSKLSQTEMYDMYQEMEPVLVHNYNHFTNMDRHGLSDVLQNLYNGISDKRTKTFI